MKKLSLEHSIRNIKAAKQADSTSSQAFAEDSVRDAFSDFFKDMGNTLKPAKEKVEGAVETAKEHTPKASSFIGSNAGPLGFGVRPAGIPSIENTRNLSPGKPEMMPTARQAEQQKTTSQNNTATETPAADPVKTTTSTSKTAPRKNTSRATNEQYSSLENVIRKIHITEFAKGGEKTIERAIEKRIPKAFEPELPVIQPTKPVKTPDRITPEVEPAPAPAKIPKKAPDRITPIEEPEPVTVPQRTTPAPVEPQRTTPAPVEPSVNPKTPTKVEPQVDPATEPQTQTKTEPYAQPKTDTQTQTKTAPKTAVKTPLNAKTPVATKTPWMPLVLPGSSNDDKGVPKDASNFAGKTHVHTARERTAHAGAENATVSVKQILKKRPMKEESESSTERKKIEYVPRGKLDPKTSLGRLASVKKLEEADLPVVDAQNSKPSHAAKIKSIVLDKKPTGMGENPIVEKEPKLKALHMAEGSATKVAQGAALGAAGVLGTAAAANPEKAKKTLGDAIVSAREWGNTNITPHTKAADKAIGSVVEPVTAYVPTSIKNAANSVTHTIDTAFDDDKLVPKRETIASNLGTKKKNYANLTPEQKLMVPSSIKRQLKSATPEGTEDKMKGAVTTTDLASYGIPVVGATRFASSAYQKAKEGQYTGAALDAASAIPGKIGHAAIAGSIAKTIVDPDEKPESSKEEDEPKKQTNSSARSNKFDFKGN